MTDRTFDVGGLEVRHLPDFSMEDDGDGNRKRVELPGKVHIGVNVNGVFVPLVERKAAGLFADIERVAKDRQTQTGQAGQTEV